MRTERGKRAAGLGDYHDAAAEQCRMAGLTPPDLSIKVDGISAAARIHGVERVWSVIARLKELGLLASCTSRALG
jgi:hypothetical protein